MKTKDFNAQFEKLKDFKNKHPEATENDEFFKSLYSTLRKYMKKLNKMDESQQKIQKGGALTPEQKDMLKKKKELELSIEEMTAINGEYMNNFQDHIEQIWQYKKAQESKVVEEVKQEDPEEVPQAPTPEPVVQAEPEPQVDVEAIRKEGYNQGYQEGRNSGVEEGKSQGYSEGRNDGYSQAKQENDTAGQQHKKQTIDLMQRAADYSSLIAVLSVWIDSLSPMEPQFRRHDYFTEEECFAIKQLYLLNNVMQPQLNFKKLVDANTERIKKLVHGEKELVHGCQNVTYTQLASAFDKALTNPQFIQTTHQFYAPDQNFMMGFSGYPPMPGQMMGQAPGMMPGQMMPGQMMPGQMMGQNQFIGTQGILTY